MDKPKKNTVEVVISGEIVTLTGVESVEYIQRVARYLDEKINQLQQEKKVSGIHSFAKTLLISINIADDLFKALAQNEKKESELQNMKEKLQKSQAEIETLRSRVEALQVESAEARADLEAYIAAFDQSQNAGNVYKLKNRK